MPSSPMAARTRASMPAIMASAVASSAARATMRMSTMPKCAARPTVGLDERIWASIRSSIQLSPNPTVRSTFALMIVPPAPVRPRK